MTPVRTIEQIRHARLLELIGSAEYPTITSLAEVLGKSHAQVSQWKNQSERRNKDGVVIGLSNIDSTSARFIEERVKKPTGWMDNDPEHDALHNADERASPSPQTRGVAHDLSELSPIVTVPLLEWDELMTAQPPEFFSLVLRDDAMAPAYARGGTMRFSTLRRVEPGRVVLVKDATGHVYVREYRLHRAEHWLAVATNQAFTALDSVTDGLEVLAVMAGWDFPADTE